MFGGFEKMVDRKAYMIGEAGNKYAWTTEASQSLLEAKMHP